MPRQRRRALERRTSRIGLITAAALFVGACQSFSLSDLDPFSSSAPQPCPHAATLGDAQTVTEFGRARSEAENNVVYRADIQRTVFECQVAGDMVTGRLAVLGQVTLGRKGRAGDLSLPIFVALTRNGSEIVSKRFDTVTVTVPRGQTTALFEKVIADYSFSLAGQPSQTYEILSGFNLTPEQIAYNRKQSSG